MTITIETDFELQAAIDPMVPALKQGLKEMGYSLSGVNAKKGFTPKKRLQSINI